MNKPRWMLKQIFGMLMVLLLLSSTMKPASAQSAGFEFKIILNGDNYEVYLRPNNTPNAPNLTLTAQVTLKVPHGVGTNRFQVSNLQSKVAGTAWAVTSRIDAPAEDRNADYLSFSVSFPAGNYAAFQWAAAGEQQVYSFRNAGPCLGAVTLMENSDPFNQLPNSTNTNPGNQIDVLGLAMDNAYVGNYGQGNAVCSLPSGDDDGDGIPNNEESIADTDGDGVPTFRDHDSDNDGIPDGVEYRNAPTAGHDTDGDGIMDYLDLDSDNDGINDAHEAGHQNADLLRDGLVDAPYGANGLSDRVETAADSGLLNYTVADTDADGTPDYLDLDSDNDSIGDLVEGGINATDNDDDGVADGPDSDGDGIVDSADGNDDGDANDFGDRPIAGLLDTDNDGTPDFRDLDRDGDGKLDITDALNGDLDANGDGAIDDTTDSDNDGIPDRADTKDTLFGGLPNPLTDADGDGLTDKAEGTGDTDGDGIPDYQDADDDGDGVPTKNEDPNADGNPANDDTDGDGKPNYLDTDDDGDTVPTKDEDIDDNGDPRNDDSDGDGKPNYLDDDDDGDGILTKIEDGNGDNNLNNDDSNNNGVPDYLDSDRRSIIEGMWLPLILNEL